MSIDTSYAFLKGGGGMDAFTRNYDLLNHPLIVLVNGFTDSNYAYFVAHKFLNDELNELRELTMLVASEFNDYKLGHFKKLPDDQLSVHFTS